MPRFPPTAVKSSSDSPDPPSYTSSSLEDTRLVFPERLKFLLLVFEVLDHVPQEILHLLLNSEKKIHNRIKGSSRLVLRDCRAFTRGGDLSRLVMAGLKTSAPGNTGVCIEALGKQYLCDNF